MIIDEEYLPLKRRDKTRFKLPIIFYVPFLALYLVYGQSPYNLPVIGGYFPSPTPTLLSTSTLVYVTPELVTYTPTRTPKYSIPSFYLSQTPVDNYGFPFDFPVILDMGEFYKGLHKVLFSYYYPDLGGTNCHDDNWVNGKCKNITASKLVGWREYMGKGIAVHPDMLEKLPFGSMIYVSRPASIKGFYTVVDLCGGCLIENNYYFDFLFDRMPDGLNWSVEVNYGVVRIGWDGVMPTKTPVETLQAVTPTPTNTPYVITQVVTPTPTFTPVYIVVTPTYTPTVTPTFTPTPEILFTETSVPTVDYTITP